MILLRILIAGIILLGTNCTEKKQAKLVDNWKIGASTGILSDFSQESFNQLKAAGVDYIEMGSGVFRDKSLEERKAFVAGAVLFILILYVMSSFIWKIDIVGCKKTEEQYIKAVLELNGAKPGVLKYGIDTDRLVSNMMLEMD